MKNHIVYLKRLGACSDAVKWAEQFDSLQEAWDNCERGDWMLWLLGKQAGKPGTKSRKKLVLTCCKCARLPLKYVPEDEKRPLVAIETAEKYAKGVSGVTLQDVRDAADAADAYAAYAAYDAADAYAAYAAYDAAYAAYDADAAYAAYDAYDAAYDAAYAADAAADTAYAAYDAARTKTLKRCADIIRKDYPKIRCSE